MPYEGYGAVSASVSRELLESSADSLLKTNWMIPDDAET
jgi:hypothetical protein